MRRFLNVVGERIVYELRGTACLQLEAIQLKQSIMSSRAFGYPIAKKELLLEAITEYAARAAQKLRRQGSRCGGLHVFLTTNRFQKHKPQYSRSCAWSFVVATSDSREIIHAARSCLASLYRPGFEYRKCGVMLLDLAPSTTVQGDLFEPAPCQRSKALMEVVDSLNTRIGRGTVSFAAQGVAKGSHQKKWEMRQQWRSLRYTTSAASELVIGTGVNSASTKKLIR